MENLYVFENPAFSKEAAKEGREDKREEKRVGGWSW